MAAPIKAIFWDNDGVLVDTEHLYWLATREALAGRGIDLDEQQYLTLFLRSSTGILHFAEKLAWPAETVEKIRAERSARYSELLRGRDHVIAGVRDVLEACHGRYAMGIVTSSQKTHFDIIHASSGLLHYFDFVLTRSDYVESKPHPEPYLKALQTAGVAPDECLVIEDSERGLAAARAAGLRCVVVPSRLTADSAFSGAARILRGIHELPALLQAPASLA